MLGPRVFLSYARTDLEAARELRQRIEAELGTNTLWHDVRDLAGDHWWTEIEETIRTDTSVEHLVLLASNEALNREVVRREWRLAWREGKAVSNVFWSDRLGFTAPHFEHLPTWIRAKSIIDLSLPDRWEGLIAKLKGPGQGARRPFMVPSMPEGFVERPEEFGRLKAALLDSEGDAIAITATLRGAGGFGKTVLAQALGHDDDIQDAFYDGILWLTLGERPNLVEKLSGLLGSLNETVPPIHDIGLATNKLRELLENRHCLLIIDDVWTESHLQPFLDGAPQTARLVTTRRDDILPTSVVRVPVDAMTEVEGVELISWGIGEVTGAEHAALHVLAKERLGEWPVIIRLVNGFLRRERERGVMPLDAIRQANERLDRKGLTYFDRSDEKARAAAVESTIRAGLDYLVEELGRGRDPKVYNDERYRELAVFPGDVDIPTGTVARLWRHIAGLDEIAARDLLKDLYSLALLQALDLKRGTMRLHDVMREYLVQQCGTVKLRRLHHDFADTYDFGCGPAIKDSAERGYFYRWFPTHLARADDREVLAELLLDPAWIERKLAEVGILPLLADYQQLVRQDDIARRQIGQTLVLVSGILTRDPRQTMLQLLGRLNGEDTAELESFLRRARDRVSAPALAPLQPTFASGGGAELNRFTFDGGIGALAYLGDDQAVVGCTDGRVVVLDLGSGAAHTVVGETPRREDGRLSGWVTALTVMPDGRVVVGAEDDGTIRVWDTEKGTNRVLRGHTSIRVAALAVLPDGRILSGSTDNTVRLWDLASANARVLAGHTHEVKALVALPDGRALSAAYDAIRLWDLTAGTNRVLGEQAHEANTLALLPDGCVLSASEFDGTIRHWNLGSGTSRVITTDSGGVMALAALDDGHALSAASDHTLRSWNLADGTADRLEGHTAWVTAVIALPNGRALSGSTDNTVRLWDLSGKGDRRRATHAGRVNALAVLSDGRVLSAGQGENTVRVWDPVADAGRLLNGHTREVIALVVLDDGRFLSGSRDSTLRLWDLTADSATVLEGHTDMITTLVLRRNGSVLSGSTDETVRMWDLASGTSRVVNEHRYFSTDRVSVLAELPDGRILFGNGWDLQVGSAAGGETVRLEELSGMHSAVTALPDGRVLVGSWDRTLELWNVTNRSCDRLDGEIEWNGVVTVLPGGFALLAGSRDRSIHLWDLSPDRTTYGTQLASFEGDAEFSCFAVFPDGRTALAGDVLGYVHRVRVTVG
jgi:WD40 repeat protein